MGRGIFLTDLANETKLLLLCDIVHKKVSPIWISIASNPKVQGTRMGVSTRCVASRILQQRTGMNNKSGLQQ
jgi:bifunctional DNase/RNase